MSLHPKFDEKSFDKAQIEKISQEFQKVQFTDLQMSVLSDLVELFQKEIPITKTALMGFGMRAVKKWQLEHNVKIEDLSNYPKPERLIEMREIFNNFSYQIKKVVSKSEKHLVDKKVDNIALHYEKNILPKL